MDIEPARRLRGQEKQELLSAKKKDAIPINRQSKRWIQERPTDHLNPLGHPTEPQELSRTFHTQSRLAQRGNSKSLIKGRPHRYPLKPNLPS